MLQIIAASSSNTGQHVVHVTGVCSLLSRPDCPFKLEDGTQLFQLGNALLLPEHQQRAGVLCAPASHSSVRTLDAVLVHFNPVFHRADEILSDTSAWAEDVERLMLDAQWLENEFAAWQAEQVGEWRPTTLTRSQLLEVRSLLTLHRDFSSYYDRIYSLLIRRSSKALTRRSLRGSSLEHLPQNAPHDPRYHRSLQKTPRVQVTASSSIA